VQAVSVFSVLSFYAKIEKKIYFYLFFFSHEGDDGMMCRKPACFYAVVAMFMGVMSGADPEGD
jgi:hypothetical protein